MRLEVASWLRSTRTRTSLVLALATVASGLLALYVVGLAGMLVLAATWMLAAGIGRAAPGLRGPATWALAIIAELVVVLGESAALALLSPHPHDRLVYLGILVVPGAMGFAIWLAAGRRAKTPNGKPEYSRWGVVLAISFGVLAIAALIASRSEYSGVAWAMSGDARNHATLVRRFLLEGGLTLGELKRYPAALNAFASVLAGSANRTGAPGAVILADAHALAATYVLAAIGVATLLAGALLQFVPKSARRARHLPASIVATVCVAAGLAGSPFILGLTLTDGFFPAYCALPIALASIVVALQYLHSPKFGGLLLVTNTAALVLAFIAWTLLAVVPGSLLVLMVAVGISREARARNADVAPASSATRWQWIALGAGALSVLGISGVFIHFLPALKPVMILTGSIQRPTNTMLLFLGLGALGMALLAKRRRVRRQMLAPLAVALGGGLALFWLVQLVGTSAPWSYYAVKTHWIVSVCLLWLPFLPLVLHLSRRSAERRNSATARGLTTVAATAVAVGIVALLGSATSATDPVRSALRGWHAPSAAVVGEVVTNANAGDSYVLWEWSDPGDDRLGNFWAVLAWGTDESANYTTLPGVPGGFYQWAYFEGDAIDDLCALAEGSPGIDVHTHAAQLQAALHDACPDARADVVDEDN